MKKIPFQQLDFEVDKLYMQEIDLEDESKIDLQVTLIANFIKACGWTEQEYLATLLHSTERTPSN